MTNKEDKEGGHEASGAVEMIFGYLAFCLVLALTILSLGLDATVLAGLWSRVVHVQCVCG
jgi:hypothetical protein